MCVYKQYSIIRKIDQQRPLLFKYPLVYSPKKKNPLVYVPIDVRSGK